MFTFILIIILSSYHRIRREQKKKEAYLGAFKILAYNRHIFLRNNKAKPKVN